MSFSVWTETRYKKESEQSKVFHLFSHDKGVFMSQLMQEDLYLSSSFGSSVL